MAQIESKRLRYQRAWAIHIVVLTAGQEKIPIISAATTVLYYASEIGFFMEGQEITNSYFHKLELLHPCLAPFIYQLDDMGIVTATSCSCDVGDRKKCVMLERPVIRPGEEPQ